ncbi:MAG: TioE family transcriptional regulator [Brevibacterium aurantiacum]|nr:TioE family transcriptional regulator [Brevibacterium aurantiacum]
MRTSKLAEVSGYSVQQIRQLESLRVIPAATRLPNGYRCFSSLHLSALLAYRELASAVGPVLARDVMSKVQHLPLIESAALISGLGYSLEEERRQVVAAKTVLTSIRKETETEIAVAERGSSARESMTITELSQALGVPPSTLRFWEKEGLVSPDRVEARSQTARVYRATAIRDARITAALRAGGYRIPEVVEAIGALHDLGDASRSLAALDERLEAVARRTLALFRAGSVLADLVDPGHR